MTRSRATHKVKDNDRAAEVCQTRSRGRNLGHQGHRGQFSLNKKIVIYQLDCEAIEFSSSMDSDEREDRGSSDAESGEDASSAKSVSEKDYIAKLKSLKV